MASPNPLPLAIIASTLFILYIPFLIYAIIQWAQNKQHYIIKKRFPTISCAMVILNSVSYTAVTIFYWLQCYITLYSVALYFGEAMQMAVFGLINLRLFLIYIRWKTTFAIIHGLSVVKIKSTKSIYHHWFSVILILLATICPMLTMFNIGKQIYWVVYIIITIALICVIVCKKVSEGISVTKETILQLFAVLFIGLLPVVNFVVPILDWPVKIMFNLAPYVQCTIVLYFPLYQINSLEKSMMKVPIEMRLRSSSQPTTNKSNTLDEDAPIPTANNIREVKKEGELFQFLHKYSNYIVFRNYMAHSWCLETLSFVEQTQILRRIVAKCTEDIEPNERRVHRIGFKYLKEMYSDFQQRIDEKLSNQEHNEHIAFNEIKNVLYQLHKEIYERFIKQDSEDAVNISFESRNCLISLFENEEYTE
eukprot:124807_1